MSKIKICGLFRGCDIDYVNESKPDYIGFVFAESRRQVTFEKAKAMRKRLLPEITPVGVFVNASQEEIEKLFQDGIISIAQLHGQEDEQYIQKLKRSGVPVIKAVRVDSAEDILKWQSSAADFLLLDNGTGGTGETFDWKLIENTGKPFFLAGGIKENNIGDALSFSPYCVDISSGAETNSVKDKEKINRLVSKVRGR